MSKTLVVHHSADFDGLFCREIARKFLPDAELVGWDFGNAPLEIPSGRSIYVLDLPVDQVFGFKYKPEDVGKAPPQHPAGLVWIDHHKSSIETHPQAIPGYRIDGVAACRLAWQWFNRQADNGKDSFGVPYPLPQKQHFIDRVVGEPFAVRLAGEYDIWDKRDPNAELFQHGLRSQELSDVNWGVLLSVGLESGEFVSRLLSQGKCLQYSQAKQNESIIKSIGFDLDWEGLRWLACNHARYNSLLFTAGLKPEHDACFGFKWTGSDWSVSLYHAPGKEHHDLSKIAVKHGGGGHRGACGFQTKSLPFLA